MRLLLFSWVGFSAVVGVCRVRRSGAWLGRWDCSRGGSRRPCGWWPWSCCWRPRVSRSNSLARSCVGCRAGVFWSSDAANGARRRLGHNRAGVRRIGSIWACPHVGARGSRARVRNAMGSRRCARPRPPCLWRWEAGWISCSSGAFWLFFLGR